MCIRDRVEDTPLSPEEQKMVNDFAEKIDITNSQMCIRDRGNGSAAAKAAADRIGPDAEPHGIAELCRTLWPEAF